MMTALLLGALFILGGYAQSTTDPTCMPSFGWMNNSREQNPCVVATYLGSVCIGEVVPLPPLLPDKHYTPEDTSPCTCNTVLYSLVSACGVCQISNNDLERWSVWSANCSNPSLFFFPRNIPSETAVPGWAYLNVTQGDTFNLAAAERNSGMPEVTGSITPTSTITATSSSATSSSASSSATASSKSPSHAGAIAGGVAGGVAFLAALSVLVFWCLLRRRRPPPRPRPMPATHSAFDASESSVVPMSQGILTPTIPSQPRHHDLSSPVPTPRSRGTATIYTTYSAYQGSVADRYTSPDTPHPREEAPEM